VSLLSCVAPPPEPPKRVFLITIDTLRADHLGMYGYPRGVSPFLDALGSDSVVFHNALSSSSHTAPSHASLFTSLYPAQHRLLRNGEVLSDRLVTLARVFQETGYATVGFTPVNFLNGLSRGFDEFRSGEVYAPAAEVLSWASEWLQGRDASAETFVWIHLFDVHEWYMDKHLDQNALESLKSAARLSGDDLVEYLHEAQGLPHGDFPGRHGAVKTIERYDGQLSSVDKQLGQFFAKVKGMGLYQDSLWVITSDHGEGLGNHGFLGHGMYIYNEQLHVPLMVHSADGRFRAARIETQVQLVDLAPTLAELVGTTFENQPIPINGRSLVRLLHDPTAGLEPVAAFAQRRPADEKRLLEGWPPGDVFAFQERGRKVIVSTEGKTEIYDLQVDPFEHTNLAEGTSEDVTAVVDELTRRFARLTSQGELVGDGEIQPEYVDELKALGYL
jgi:arylsulfatase A-like enzyme